MLANNQRAINQIVRILRKLPNTTFALSSLFRLCFINAANFFLTSKKPLNPTRIRAKPIFRGRVRA